MNIKNTLRILQHFNLITDLVLLNEIILYIL